MSISSAEVVRLRKVTGAGMMDCKNALEEANGDFDRAITIIREKGKAIANKRADRDATEGVTLAKVNNEQNFGVMMVLNCETDFVAKNESFINFAKEILELALDKKPANRDALLTLPFKGKNVNDIIIENIGIIGEKLDLPFYDFIKADFVVPYIHPGNKVASMVGFNQKISDVQVGKDVAMQIAAMNPVSIDIADVPGDVREREFEIGREQARNEGKAENMLDKIAEGRLQKFYKESTLLNQAFIKDNKITIKQYLDKQNKGLSVTKFLRYSLNL